MEEKRIYAVWQSEAMSKRSMAYFKRTSHASAENPTTHKMMYINFDKMRIYTAAPSGMRQVRSFIKLEDVEGLGLCYWSIGDNKYVQLSSWLYKEDAERISNAYLDHHTLRLLEPNRK